MQPVTVGTIPGSVTAILVLVINGTPTPTATMVPNQRLCGRTLDAISNSVITGASVCSEGHKSKKVPLKPKHSILVFPSPAAQVRPFRITLKADADEVGTTTAADMAATNEQSDAVSVLTKKEL